MHASLALFALLLEVREPVVESTGPSAVIERLETDDSTEAQVWLLDDATVVVWLEER